MSAQLRPVDPSFPLVVDLRPRLRVAANLAAVNEALERGEPVHEQAARPEWLPTGWEGHTAPAELTQEAARQWIEWALLGLRGLQEWAAEAGEPELAEDAGDVWRDVQRLLAAGGWVADVTPEGQDAKAVAWALERLAWWLAAAEGDERQRPRKRPGRRKADYDTIQREAALAERWERARASGEYKADFARREGLTLKALDALLGRVRKRKSGAE